MNDAPERAPGLVTKRELLDRVWPGLTVEEGNLRFQIRMLRKALGEQQGVSRYVSTVQGRGYCFAANVSRALHANERAAPGREPRPANDADTNLPLPMHPIIDRERELAELEDDLRQHRLVTLVGTGGVGKTRLAIELGRRVLPHYPDGVWLVDLAPVSDPALIASATAKALGLSDGGEEPTAAAIAQQIAKQRLLLIFDNCEHLIDAVAQLGETLLHRVGALTVLATSQESLRIAGEQVFRLEPLSLAPVGATDVAQYGAVALFLGLVGRVDRRFVLTVENAESVAEICRRLDRVPLALEMAAARLPLLGIEGLSSGLTERLSLLKAGPRGSDLRHSTLRQVAAWSFDLLDEVDKAVFCRLAVFPGSFALDAAVEIMAPFGLDRWETLDALWRLREKSLVAVEHDETPRYRLLETLRIFAAEKLAERGETDVAAGAHADCFTTLMKRAYAAWLRDMSDEWERICVPEIDNIRAAVEWALGAPDRASIARELISVSGILAFPNGSRDLKRYAAAAVPLLDGETRPLIAARLARICSADLEEDNHAVFRDRAKRSLALARIAGDKIEIGYSLLDVASAEGRAGADQEATNAFDESAQISREINFPRLRLRILSLGAFLAYTDGDPDGARHMLLTALDISRTAKNRFWEQTALSHLAEVEFAAGNHEQAIELARQGLEVENKGRRPNLGAKWLRINLASYLCVRGDIAVARLDETGEFPDPTEVKLIARSRGILAANLAGADIENCMAKGAGWSEAEAFDFATRHLIRDEG